MCISFKIIRKNVENMVMAGKKHWDEFSEGLQACLSPPDIAC